MSPLPPLTLNAWMRYDLIQRALAVVPPGATMLEIGAGLGAMGVRFAGRYRYTGLEPDPVSARVARRRIEAVGGVFIEGTTDALPVTQTYEVVGAFEVLEHMEDDAAGLRQWVRWLAPRGFLVLSVPAFQRRFAAADRRVGHFRRYDPEGLRERLTGAGLQDVEIWVSGFPLGLLLEQGRNVLAMMGPKGGSMAMRTGESGRWRQPPRAFAVATDVLTAPFRALQRPFARLPWGTGLVARAQKPLGSSS